LAALDRALRRSAREELFTVGHVLVLNATYQRLNFISIQRAIVLLLKEKAEPIEVDRSSRLHSERMSIDSPIVIRLVNYVHVPYERFTVPLSRRTLINRDNHTCQFCGDTAGPLTIDHVIPKSRGGATSWENCVAACLPCNHRKANRTPDEAHMRLRNVPRRPSDPFSILFDRARHNDVWERYA
jgi:5-methylcytosine-specific restriction endonuclease McrA